MSTPERPDEEAEQVELQSDISQATQGGTPIDSRYHRRHDDPPTHGFTDDDRQMLREIHHMTTDFTGEQTDLDAAIGRVDADVQALLAKVAADPAAQAAAAAEATALQGSIAHLTSIDLAAATGNIPGVPGPSGGPVGP